MNWRSQLAKAYRQLIACPTGKAPHKTEASAQQQMEQLNKMRPNYCGEVYRCLHCNLWHVGADLWEYTKRRCSKILERGYK